MIENGEAVPGWSTMLNINITDDLGHAGHGACGGGLIPDAGRVVGCGVLFIQ